MYLFLLPLPFVYLYVAPTGPPDSLRVENIKTHNSLTIHWKMPPVSKLHGDLLAYRVQYKIRSQGGVAVTSANIINITTHPTINTLKLSALLPNTEYEISASAVNQYGIGVAATVNAGMTLSMYVCMCVCVCVFRCVCVCMMFYYSIMVECLLCS